jgi:hypothetical protein
MTNSKHMESSNPYHCLDTTTIFSKIYVDVMSMPVAGEFKFIVAAKDDLTLAVEGRWKGESQRPQKCVEIVTLML